MLRSGGHTFAAAPEGGRVRSTPETHLLLGLLLGVPRSWEFRKGACVFLSGGVVSQIVAQLARGENKGAQANSTA